MNLFNNPDLDNRVIAIKSKIDSTTSPSNIDNVSENGIQIAKELLDETLYDLKFIKNEVGENNENYIKVSESIALAAAGCIKFPISFLGMLTQASDFRKDRNLVNDTKRKITEATRLMGIITALPMNYEARQLVNKVNIMITNAEGKVSKGGGCFVATFAFDDYNSKEVLFLRYYRDKKLRSTIFGRTFISVYYSVSPKIVLILRRIPYSKKISQKIILSLIKILKK